MKDKFYNMILISIQAEHWNKGLWDIHSEEYVWESGGKIEEVEGRGRDRREEGRTIKMELIELEFQILHMQQKRKKGIYD